jgi:hypothetical protein
MGFHKRFITKDLVLSQRDFESIDSLLNADALIFDTWSSNFFKRFDNNYKIYQEKRNNYIKENKFSSSFTNTDGFDKYYISNVLINLKISPSWLDIHLCIESFRPIEIPQSISGKFDLLCNFCIQLIENKLEENGLQ